MIRLLSRAALNFDTMYFTDMLASCRNCQFPNGKFIYISEYSTLTFTKVARTNIILCKTSDKLYL